MRYNGGVLGGTWQPMFWSDLGGGVFDGAHLVMNFEQLNPSRNFFRKYYDLYADVDHGRERFLEFERWWGGFFLLNEAEIRWIVEQLFVGNRLTRNLAQLEPGRPIDLKNDPGADHRLHQPRRQHHPTAAGTELDPRHLYRRAGDPDPRPAHHLHDPPRGRAISASSSPPRSRGRSTPRSPRR